MKIQNSNQHHAKVCTRQLVLNGDAYVLVEARWIRTAKGNRIRKSVHNTECDREDEDELHGSQSRLQKSVRSGEAWAAIAVARGEAHLDVDPSYFRFF